MNTTQEVYEKIVSLYENFTIEHVKTTKVAHKNARKSLSELKKLISEYNKLSVAEDKTK
jgi:hypothetical protein